MTAEKTQAPADPGVSVTLYKAVTATVTCAQFRSYLSSIGMRLVNLEGDDETEAWVGVDGRRVYVSGDADDMEHAIARLAKIVSVSPGEMLMRIVGPTSSYPGAVPWRSRAHVSAVIQALVYRDATDTQAADFLAGHVEDIRADYMRRLTLEPVPTKFVSPAAQKAAEDMRERCVDVLERAAKVRDEGEEHGRATGNEHLRASSKSEGKALRHALGEVRALPLPAEAPPGAWVADESGHPDAADVIRDAAKAWAALHGERAAHVIVEPDARPYDDRCRNVMPEGRCRYAWDHAKRSVDCKPLPGSMVPLPPTIADPSVDLRARLVAELHAAGRPQFADLVAQRGDWRALIRFIDTMAMALLSDQLRRDLGIEAPK